ncbi:MAG: type II toxin-antitoxin system Phd/YefM family antitoxin [Acetobacteraceae bacterium]
MLGVMKTVNVHEAKTTLSGLLAEVEQGAEVTIARNGTPVARLVRVTAGPQRAPGLLAADPAWQDFSYDPKLFAPMTDEELAAEGWE